MLLLLVPLIWLAVVTIVMTACRVAALADLADHGEVSSSPQLTAPVSNSRRKAALSTRLTFTCQLPS